MASKKSVKLKPVQVQIPGNEQKNNNPKNNYQKNYRQNNKRKNNYKNNYKKNYNPKGYTEKIDLPKIDEKNTKTQKLDVVKINENLNKTQKIELPKQKDKNYKNYKTQKIDTTKIKDNSKTQKIDVSKIKDNSKTQKIELPKVKDNSKTQKINLPKQIENTKEIEVLDLELPAVKEEKKEFVPPVMPVATVTEPLLPVVNQTESIAEKVEQIEVLEEKKEEPQQIEQLEEVSDHVEKEGETFAIKLPSRKDIETKVEPIIEKPKKKLDIKEEDKETLILIILIIVLLITMVFLIFTITNTKDNDTPQNNIIKPSKKGEILFNEWRTSKDSLFVFTKDLKFSWYDYYKEKENNYYLGTYEYKKGIEAITEMGYTEVNFKSDFPNVTNLDYVYSIKIKPTYLYRNNLNLTNKQIKENEKWWFIIIIDNKGNTIAFNKTLDTRYNLKIEES